MDFVIGGLAGAGATIVTNPMDVIKTRLQLQGELKSKSEQTTRYRGIFHALYVIAKADGALALQKGLAPAMVLGFTMNSVRLGMYHIAEVQCWTKHKDGDISINKAIFWASASGVMSGVAANPASVVKTRMQSAAHPSIAVGRQHRYNGMFDGIATIYRTEGVRGFFAGVTATCTRLAFGSAAQLTTFSAAKERLLAHGICTDSQVGLAFCASAISGVVVALVICPLDVTTVRLYNQGKLLIFQGERRTSRAGLLRAFACDARVHCELILQCCMCHCRNAPRRGEYAALQSGIGCSRRSSLYRNPGLSNKDIQKRRPARLVQRTWTIIFKDSTPHHPLFGHMGHVK